MAVRLFRRVMLNCAGGGEGQLPHGPVAVGAPPCLTASPAAAGRGFAISFAAQCENSFFFTFVYKGEFEEFPKPAKTKRLFAM